MTTFFARLDPKYLKVPENAMIELEMMPFLKATKAILPFFDMLGTPFKTVKVDMEGNITKLSKIYEKNPDKYATIYGMLQDEIATKTTRHKESAAIALLWLKRALEFTVVFLQQIVDDHKAGKHTDSMHAFCVHAYDTTLRSYHTWILQKVFPVISHMLPWKSAFLTTIAFGKENMEDEVVEHMDAFLIDLSANLNVVKDMYRDLDLDFQDKV
ncbi:Glycolipid transfer protein [Lamellibrachia satsuma]|nr:Glycolipid transfer protein [Lamellibrachia satsuma]